MSLKARVDKLEQSDNEGREHRRWDYWDAYTPQEREEMDGRVNWIVEGRPDNRAAPSSAARRI